MIIQRRACYALALAALFGLSAGAHAATHWDGGHPRREQVNTHHARLHEEHRHGGSNRFEARDMHRHVHVVPGNHGHFGYPGKHVPYHYQNGIGHEIRR